MQCFAMQAHFLSLPKEYKSCAVIITINFIIWWPTLSMIFGQEEKLVIFARSSMAGEQKPWMARSRSSMNWCKCCKKNIYVSRFLDKSKPAVHSHRRKLWGVGGGGSSQCEPSNQWSSGVSAPPTPQPSFSTLLVSNTSYGIRINAAIRWERFEIRSVEELETKMSKNMKKWVLVHLCFW